MNIQHKLFSQTSLRQNEITSAAKKTNRQKRKQKDRNRKMGKLINRKMGKLINVNMFSHRLTNLYFRNLKTKTQNQDSKKKMDNFRKHPTPKVLHYLTKEKKNILRRHFFMFSTANNAGTKMEH